MLFQENLPQLAHEAINVQRVLESIVPAIIIGVLGYFLARRKNNSEISNNEAQIEKSHAEVIKLYIEMIKTLNDEISDWIIKVKGLRGEVDGVVKENDDLKSTRKSWERQEEIRKVEQKENLKKDKEILLVSIENTIKEMTELLDILISHSAHQKYRMKAVKILELLHTFKEKLNKQD